jgi:hypothetical protein
MALTYAKYTVIPEGSEGDYPESKLKWCAANHRFRGPTPRLSPE